MNRAKPTRRASLEIPRQIYGPRAWLAVSSFLLAALLPGAAAPAAELPATPQGKVVDGTAQEQQDRQNFYSPLTAINAQTVGRLGFAWSYDLGTVRGQEATPLVVDGVLYTSGYFGIVYALDAASGKEKWRFDPSMKPMSLRHACCDTVNRGVAVSGGRVYVASVDGRLHALEAATGRELWSKDTFIEHDKGYSSTGAPAIAHDVVVVGNSGGDMGHDGVRGYVSAYDLGTGALKWRFFTVPPPAGGKFEHPELKFAAKSWDQSRGAASPAGATVWALMTYDSELNLLYFGTGNAAPYDARTLRPNNGDDLFACSILAINPDTGRMAWYYQTTPGDRWDFDATANLVLADLKIGGQHRRVLMQANKNGFFYVLDRATGKLISAEKFAPANWASAVDPATGKPVVNEVADFFAKPKNIFPSNAGAHSWQPMSSDPATHLVYVPVVDMSGVITNSERNGGRVKYVNGSFAAMGVFVDQSYDAESLKSLFGPLPGLKAIQSERKGKILREMIRAWDPVSQKLVWEHETSSDWRGYDGGILGPAGNLVFQGRGCG